MNIIYSDDAEDVVIESIWLNGRPGAVNITDSNDDLDLTFEDAETAKAWLKLVRKGLKALEGR